MGLDSLVRAIVATANHVTSTLQCNVTFYAWISDGDNSEPTYASPITLRAVVDLRQRRITSSTGEDIIQKARITFVGPVEPNGASNRREPIDPRDKIVLPNGYTGPILNVLGPVDPSTGDPYAPEVILG